MFLLLFLLLVHTMNLHAFFSLILLMNIINLLEVWRYWIGITIDILVAAYSSYIVSYDLSVVVHGFQ